MDMILSEILDNINNISKLEFVYKDGTRRTIQSPLIKFDTDNIHYYFSSMNKISEMLHENILRVYYENKNQIEIEILDPKIYFNGTFINISDKIFIKTPDIKKFQIVKSRFGILHTRRISTDNERIYFEYGKCDEISPENVELYKSAFMGLN
jgi:hypothetical protein